MLIAGIVVGERRREDYGDVAGLAASIQRYGLLHPIVVDGDGHLVAGGRRLEAVKSLGWASVEARSLGDLTTAERDEIELEENLQRKDLTAHERSKTLVKLAETAKAVIQSEPTSVESPPQKSAHRPDRPGSLRDVAERIGVDPTTIVKAQQHVEIADEFPALQAPDWKQYHVLEAREKLAKLPETERPKAVALVSHPGTPPKDAIAILGNLAAKPAAVRERIFQKAESADQRDRSDALTEAWDRPAMPDPRVSLLIDAAAPLSRAVRLFPDDPMTPHIANAQAVVKEVLAALKEYRRDA